ncbi:MAG: hypothetical protein HYY93_16865 [Planctomycetes bacterium]|nr:hypothetical protein [Planctomycetota bacterium]
MMKRTSGRGMAWVLALFLAGAARSAAAEEPDVITDRNGKKIECIIQKEDANYINYGILVDGRLGGGSSKIKLDDVKDIEYGEQPGDFGSATRATQEGEYEKALPAWDKVLKDAKGGGRALFAPHALYWRGYCYGCLGQPSKAAAELGALFKDYPDTRFLREGFPMYVDALIGTRDIGGAKTAAKQMEEAVKKAQLGNELQARAQFLNAKCLEAEGKFTDAATAYGRVQSSASSLPIGEEAAVAKARCMFLDNKVSQAQSEYQRIADAAKNHAALAGAWNGIGDCLSKTAEGTADPKAKGEVYREALFAYLRPVACYAPDGDASGTAAEEHAKALFHAARCIKVLIGGLPADKREEYTRWGGELKQEVITTYPSSPWAARAKAELGGL